MKIRKSWALVGTLLIGFMLVLSACGRGTGGGIVSAAGLLHYDRGALDEKKVSHVTEDSCLLADIKNRGKLIVGVKYDTERFGMEDPVSGEVEGFDVDVARALAKKLFGDESKLELIEVTSESRIPMLKSGEIDLAVAAMTITEERRQEVDFSDIYFNDGQSLLVKKGSDIRGINDVDSNTVVLAVKGETSAANIENRVPGIRVVEYGNYQDAFAALQDGLGEALTTDNAILSGLMKQDPDFEIVGSAFTDEPYGIAVRKGETALVEAVNELLYEMKESGEYNRLYKKWIGEKAPVEHRL